jgi:GMP synthase (glutamine-hydrolysing) A subunit
MTSSSSTGRAPTPGQTPPGGAPQAAAGDVAASAGALDRIVVLDFGSQFTQLIARRIREQHVYAEIHPYNLPLARLREMAPKGIILSGGPASVYDADAPLPDAGIFELGVPVLGICYGLQAMAHLLGGRVEKDGARTGHGGEFGRAQFRVGEPDSPLFAGMPADSVAWMSHGDAVTALPDGFHPIGRSDDCRFAAVAHPGRRLFGLQFHPEVAHTESGAALLRNFLFQVCDARPNGRGTSSSRRCSAIRDRQAQDACSPALRRRRLLGGSGAAPQGLGDRLTCSSWTTGSCARGRDSQRPARPAIPPQHRLRRRLRALPTKLEA